jgi:hypothetical protein
MYASFETMPIGFLWSDEGQGCWEVIAHDGGRITSVCRVGYHGIGVGMPFKLSQGKDYYWLGPYEGDYKAKAHQQATSPCTCSIASLAAYGCPSTRGEPCPNRQDSQVAALAYRPALGAWDQMI